MLKLSDRDNKILNMDINAFEIKVVTFSMKGLKAPGPNGFQFIFYQNFWNTVSGSLIHFITNYFHNLDFPTWLNNSLITLIPKVDNPESVNHLHPIMLCNIVYKIITKVIVCRLRPFFKKNYVLGRQTKDNMIISQEIIHTLEKREKKGGKLGV